MDRPITLAGGVANNDEILGIIEAGFNVQIGRALYENRIDLVDAWIAPLTLDDRGLIPTIVQDATTRDVLMMAYSNRESLRNALVSGEGWYYSRSRAQLWRKGETSGNTQRLVSARWDCDRDCVIFLVEQTGPACHLGRDTCFGNRGVDVLNRLDATIAGRSVAPPSSSYTRRLLDDPKEVAAKLREETEEVIVAESADEIAWESADVLYHLMVRMRAAGVPLVRVLAELRSRFTS